ncbi:MAG: hypothetical protein ACYC46_06960 [Acidobacteriaceae bacterium]
MSNLAANPAALSNLLLRMVTRTKESHRARTNGGGPHSSCEDFGSSNIAAIATNLCGQSADENFGPVWVCRLVSRLCLGHGFGAFHAPSGSSLFCFGYAALRVTVSLQILFGKYAEKISPDPP